ncbi:hypothetical protein [Clostridium sp. 2218st1_F5_2218SCRN_220325]|jgi:hypothetical protein|uniref:hypothetical protein n=1 Tax=Clostridium sp. 2218st1_F5_2218SCRN_220325 TaxID=3143056 RepID=UPI0025E6630F|nr:hypothetical protein [uncultured Intestinibacter sp.]
MSNKKIYKGLNKRRRFHPRKYITIILCMALIIGYGYKKIKLDEVFKNIDISKNVSSLVNKLYFWQDPASEIFNLASTSTQKIDNSSQKNVTDKSNEEKSQKSSTADNSSTNTEVAVVDGIDVYLIQVGSFDNNKDLNKITARLKENKIPNSSIKIDGANKVQAYISFNEDDVRNNLEKTKKIVDDAFLTKLEIPVLSLEYTEEYSYIKDIADNLNSLLKNYEEESNYLNKNKDNLDSGEYKIILTKRENILDKLENEVNKINYKELDSFKTNLLSYTSQIRDNISKYGDKIDTKNEYKYETLLISSIQMYYEFINEIKAA